jgi:uncharacterized membrane protein
MSTAAIETESTAPPPLTRSFCALGLLAIEGASIGLAGWFLRSRDKLPTYIGTNFLAPAARQKILLSMLVCALVAVGVGAGVWISRRAAGLDLIDRASRRLAPLCLAAVVPLLFQWQLWAGGGSRELTYLVMVTAFGLALQALTRVALETPPVLPAPWRARIDAVRARAAARLNRMPWLPLAIVGVAVIGYSAFFSIVTIQNHVRLGTAGYDMGIENNLVWNAAHFNAPLFKTSVIGGPTSTHIGYHETYISYLIGIPYRLAPYPESLLALQATLIGGAALPLYAFAKRHLGPWLACLIAVICVFYAPMHGSNLYDFHYLPFAPILLWTTLWLLEARRDRLATVAVILTLANREDMSALLMVIGAYLILTGERPRAGLLVTIVGGVYFVTVKLILMPHFLHGWSAYVNQYQDLLPEGDKGYGGVLKTVFGNPGYTTTTLLESEKAAYLMQIMSPLVFFPWRRPIGLLCTLPGFFFTLLATKYPPLTEISFQYTAYWTAFLFIAVVANLTWLKRVEREAAQAPDAEQAVPRARASRRAWIVAMAVATLATSYQMGLILQQNTAWGGFSPFRVGLSPADKARHADLHSLIKQIPPTASVAASEMLVAQISSRKNAYTLRIGIFDADYILARLPMGGDERNLVVDALRTGAYGVQAEKGEFILFRRGAPRDSADAFLRRIGG